MRHSKTFRGGDRLTAIDQRRRCFIAVGFDYTAKNPWEDPMPDRIASRRFCAASVLVLLLLLNACDKAEPVDPVTETDAAANPPASPVAAEPVAAAPQRELVSEVLPYAEVDEELVYGYFVFPADMVTPLPAVIVIHDWYGLDDHMRDTAARLAAEGYIVLAVDLFHGKTADGVSGARSLMQEVLENPEPALVNIRQAYEFVASVGGAPRIGVLGWSMGGGLALETAMLFPDELDAAVVYYGQVTDDETKLAPITAPVLGLFAGNDRGITVDAVRAFEAAMSRLDKPHTIQIYPDVRHAFANPKANGYNAATAGDAWQQTVDFLAAQLAADDGGD